MRSTSIAHWPQIKYNSTWSFYNMFVELTILFSKVFVKLYILWLRRQNFYVLVLLGSFP